MISIRSIVGRGFALPLIAFMLTAGSAKAISLPDFSTCSSSGNCLEIDNSGSGTGIFGYGEGTGVTGHSANGIGVYGISNTWGGVIGQTSSSTAAAVSGVSPNSSGMAFYGIGGIAITGSVAQKAGGGSWSAPSDERIKKDVNALKWGLAELERIRPVTFKYNGLGGTDDDGREYVGVIAQELEGVFPTMVTSRKAKLHKNDAQETDIKVVDPSAFTYVLVNAVKEQQEVIDRQEARIAALERARGPLSASFLNGGIGAGLALGLLPLAFVALRRRKSSTA